MYLLGQMEYLWHDTNTSWNKAKDDIFATRLQSSSVVDGPNMQPLRSRYMLQYKNSLIGKYFKALQQLAVFHLHDEGLCSDRVFDLWKATGELGALM